MYPRGVYWPGRLRGDRPAGSIWTAPAGSRHWIGARVGNSPAISLIGTGERDRACLLRTAIGAGTPQGEYSMVRIWIALALLAGGCASRYAEPPLPLDHPANPGAQPGPAMVRSETLRLDNVPSAARRAAPPASPPAGHDGHGHASGVSGDGAGRAPASTADVVYTCPMHPELVSSEPGRCAKCCMELVSQGGGRP